MKRFIALFLCMVTFITTPSITSHASVLSNVTNAIATGISSAEEAYELSVIGRMAGRCGATTPTGAKGIAFEAVLSDKMNLENSLKVWEENYVTRLTKSPNAKCLDLVVLDEDTKKLVERIQCKDTPSASATNEVIKAVKAGKYNSAQLVGTTESAAAFNTKASAEGLSKVMKDSGISTEFTEKIAERALGNISDSSNMLKKAKKMAKNAAFISGGFAVIDSVDSGDDAFDTVGNLVTGVATGAVGEYASEIVGCTAAQAVSAMSLSTGAAVIATFVIVCGTSILIMDVVESMADKFEVAKLISEYAKKGYAAVCDGAAELISYVDVEAVKDGVVKTTATVGAVISNTASNVGEWCVKSGNSLWNSTTNLYGKARDKLSTVLNK